MQPLGVDSRDTCSKCGFDGTKHLKSQMQKQARITVLRKVGIGIGIALAAMLVAALLATLIAGSVFMAMPAVALGVGIGFSVASGMVIGSGVALALGVGIGGTATVVFCVFFNAVGKIATASLG